MARSSVFALNPETKVTLSFVAMISGAVYWLVMLGARVDATEQRVATIEQAQGDLQHEILERLDGQGKALNSMSVDVASIQARVEILIEWSGMKSKRPNSRP